MLRAGSDTLARWVLASDASCQTCRQISYAISAAVDGKLEMLPLNHPEVQRWREQSFGASPAWEPALFRVRGAEVRAWTGPGMAAPLVRRLGLRSTLRLVVALGQLKHEVQRPRMSAPQTAGMDRKQFLRFGAGIAVAGGLVLTGRTPAFAEKAQASAQAWVKANQARLPQTYDALIQYSMPYRKEIYRAVSTKVRSDIWVTQVDRFRAGRRELSAEQIAVLDRIRTVFAEERTFLFEDEGASAARPDLDQLRVLAGQAFGQIDAYALLASLGPVPAEDAAMLGVLAVDCTCNLSDDWCSAGGCWCTGCTRSSWGCGTALLKSCNGMCCA
ncbi:bacteriocin fulvocin C-related protein [Micromonospora sp. NPDC023956]|uniref:bacteriocin fulvocin C-related protein n=1 Tax=Micromonospora sp. NPDC023956 TaxID=3155722 RepID=UPI0033E2E203